MYIGLNTAIVGQNNPSLTQIVSSLFSNGEQGVWYDPSDLSTLFQDSYGTIPVTGTEQPVGLMLDKSKGLVLGPELVTNGALTSGIGWTDTGIATITYSAAGARLVSPANGAPLLSQNYAGAVNKTYVVDAEVVMHATPIAQAAVAVNIGGVGEDLFVATQTGLIAGNTYRLHGKVRLTSAITFLLRIGSSGGLHYALDFTIRNLSIRELPGNHATQSTTASRPTLQIDTAGNYYLSFDGVDDYLSTRSIDFTATDKMTVWAGVRKLSENGLIAETSVDSSTNAGSFYLSTYADEKYYFRSNGTVPQQVGSSAITPPITNTLTGLGNISGDLVTLRVNGAQVAQSTADQGTGNYGNYPLYIGRRGGTTLSFNGRLYGLVVRGALSSTAEITSAESYMNTFTRAY